tara:strand:+ start:1248 stop:1691 length:444 start_codon:yes stop_codon:yes gene_type:complete
MPSLLTSSEKANLTGILGDVYDTFSREIVVYKEPTKKVTTIDESFLYGYEDVSNIVNYNYIPQSGKFDATVKYNLNQDTSDDININGASISEGMVRIKVREDCKDYIEDGTTEKIVFDGASFNVATDYAVKNFLGSVFYVYYLERTK